MCVYITLLKNSSSPLKINLRYSIKECSICNGYRDYLKHRALDFNVLNYDKININKVNKRINLNK